MKDEQRFLPHSLECEEVAIASCLLVEDGSVYDSVSQIITSSDFYKTSHRIIFNAIGSLVSEGCDVNELTLIEKLRSLGKEEAVGGISSIYSILDSAETPGQAVYASKIVKEKSRLRDIIRYARIASETAYQSEEPSETISAKLETELQSLQDIQSSSDGSISIATTALREEYKDMLSGTFKTTAMSTGIKQLDEKLNNGGIGNGEVFVVTAPTSCGKTQLALNIVLRAGVSENKAGLYFSFEMPAKQLANRMTQTASATNIRQMQDGAMNASHQKRVWESLAKLESSPIFTEHYVRNIDELRSKARTAKRKHGIKWIVIDYLQLVPWDKRMKKADGIAEVSHQVKLMAIELDLPVILLAQVNREGAKRETGLTLYDLKDSGDIENDADVILLMWPDGADVDEAKRVDGAGKPYVSLKYNIAKNREGERDQKGKFLFYNHIGRFH